MSGEELKIEMKKSLYLSEGFDPAINLGFEEYLLNSCEEDEVILYLWQNAKTIVIGKHQNPYKECDLPNMRRDGIHLVRRKSGGGAVFHDMGNLNFTFIAHDKHYDKSRHFQVILDALKTWGIEAEQTGRNDIAVDGKKFSGNAFLHTRGRGFHHGTLLVDVNMKELGQYLTPPPIKLVGKGIDSVRSRVVNLKELNGDLTIEGLKKSMVEAFDRVYDGPLEPKLVPGQSLFADYSQHYADWVWTIGRSPKSTMSLGKRFEWGNLVMDLDVRDGIIHSCAISSDTLLDEPLLLFQDALMGLRVGTAEISVLIDSMFVDERMCEDLKGFMHTLM